MTYTFGLDTFGDRNGDADGKPLSHAETIRNYPVGRPPLTFAAFARRRGRAACCCRGLS